MPIEIGEVSAQIQVDPAPAEAPHEGPASAPDAAAMLRWQWLARREQQLAERLSAWGRED